MDNVQKLRHKGCTYLVATAFISAVVIYNFTEIFLLAKLPIFMAAIYMLLQRRARWDGSRWLLDEKKGIIQLISEVPWYFGDTYKPWVFISLLDAATPSDTWWEKLGRLWCGKLTVKTKMQEGDDKFLKDIWPTQHHEFLSDLILALVAEVQGYNV